MAPLTLAHCEASLSECLSTCNSTHAPTSSPTYDPCDNYVMDYDLGLHVGAIFIIMGTSLVGVTAPLLVKRAAAQSDSQMSGYWIACGKLVGTGVVLACSLVHMLQPSAASLTSPCVPWEFNTDYNAYAYLYAMLAMILMHLMENVVRVEVFGECESDGQECDAHVATAEGGGGPVRGAGGGDAGGGDGAARKSAASDDAAPKNSAFTKHYRRQVQTIAMEIGLTMHSVFVGLLVGVTGNVLPNGAPGFSVLLVALGFHQFFEGVALGARLADMDVSLRFCAAFILVFILSCPLGIACGILYVTSVNPNGSTMLLVQGTFDGVCAGLLLYVGTQLLHIDFPEDMIRFANNSVPHARLKRFGMFLSLWVGAGFMAFIGKYL